MNVERVAGLGEQMLAQSGGDQIAGLEEQLESGLKRSRTLGVVPGTRVMRHQKIDSLRNEEERQRDGLDRLLDENDEFSVGNRMWRAIYNPNGSGISKDANREVD